MLIFKKGFSFLLAVGLIALILEVLLQVGVRSHRISYYHPLDAAYYSYNAVPYFSKPCCVSDSISGFRWENTGAEAIKICNGKTIFRQVIKPNSIGFNSPNDFQPRKKDSTTFRWLVFGDSFTDGYFLSSNWTNAVTNILKEKSMSSVELHSFALNGTGVKTWVRIFDWLNTTNYEYDGIILACFGNDFSRDYFVMQHDSEYCYYGWCDSLYPTVYKQLLRESKIVDISTHSAKEALEGRQVESNFTLLLPYYLNVFFVEVKQNWVLKTQAQKVFEKYIFADTNKAVSNHYMQGKYGIEKYRLLVKMLDRCKLENKNILFASVPELKGATFCKAGGEIQLNRELNFLAGKYNAGSFDGYGIFDTVNEDLYFLKYDGHWNQMGSDLFANRIANVIVESTNYIKR